MIEIYEFSKWRNATESESRQIQQALDGLHPDTDGLKNWYAGQLTKFVIYEPMNFRASPDEQPKPPIEIEARLVLI